MNGATAHLVMELEEKLVELEGLQGNTCGDIENRFKHKIQNKTNTASDLLHEDSEWAPTAQVQLKKDHKSSWKTSELTQQQHTLCVFHWSCE